MHLNNIKYSQMNIILQSFHRHCVGIAGPLVGQIVPREIGIKRNNPRSIVLSLILLINPLISPGSVSQTLTGGGKR